MASLAKIAKLERALTDKPSDPNPLLSLLAAARHADPEVAHKASWALYRVFGAQLAAGRVGGITGEATATAEAKDVKGWIRDRLLEFVGVLGGMLCDSEAALRVSLAAVCVHLTGAALPQAVGSVKPSHE